MKLSSPRLCGSVFVSLLLFVSQRASASDWRTVSLPARPLNIISSDNVLWACGADELIANSADGGKTWNVRHRVSGGALFLTIGGTAERFLYAAGTGGVLFFTKDGGTTWIRVTAPASVVYAASFSDDQHGLVQTPHAIYRTSDGGAAWSAVNIDFSAGDFKGFPYVRTLTALDGKHMIIVMSEGNADYYGGKLLITKDGGATWKPVDIPSTGVASLSTYGGEYWAAGVEVIEKNKPGGGYGVPVVLHSADGEAWTHIVKWAPVEFSACNAQTCLFGDGAGADFRAPSPRKYWTFPAEKAVTGKWAVADGGICSVGEELRCAAVTPAGAIPKDIGDSPIPTVLAPPPLNAPANQGLQCIACGVERIVVTQDFQGVAEVEMKVHVAENGLVDNVEVVHATRAEIGTRLASQVRNWIFIPYEKDGVVHPVGTTIKLRVQAIKSN